VNRARQLTLIGLVAVVIAFAAPWATLSAAPCADVSRPASLFRWNIGQCDYNDTLQRRVLVLFGSAAVVIVLLGLAFGAGRRDRPEVTPP
jgi:hypothetical protein